MSASILMKDSRPGTLAMLAFACGVMVANIYLCQPLLAEMARSFGVTADKAALVAVATQVGYTLGILFVVPLADGSDPVKLIRRMMLLTIVGLIAAALAPELSVLLVASVSIAATCVVAQIMIPLATTLAPPAFRGRIVSKLSTGLILGILLSRTFSGLAAEYLGSWRAPFLLEALLVAVLFFVLPRFLPTRNAAVGVGVGVGYWNLIKSLPPLLRHRELQLSMALSLCCFAGFSALWATLAFHLSSPTFGLGPAAAGLFGLWGAPGALLAPVAGRLADRWGPGKVNACALMSMGACFLLAATFGQSSIAALVVAINLLDFGMQSGQVANQARIFGLSPEIRARLNTLYMGVTFGGGALGALVGGWVWSMAGWVGICWLGGCLVVMAALVLGCASVFACAAAKTPAR